MLELLAFFELIHIKEQKTGTTITVRKGYIILPEYSLVLNSNISHAVTNFLGCCFWVGMDLRALWSTEEKFGVEILFWVGRQAKRRLVLEKRSLIWWHSLICFECTVVAPQVLLHSDPKVSGPLFTSVKRYFLKKILTVKSHHLFVNIKNPLHNQCLLLLTKAASVCWACF